MSEAPIFHRAVAKGRAIARNSELKLGKSEKKLIEGQRYIVLPMELGERRASILVLSRRNGAKVFDPQTVNQAEAYAGALAKLFFKNEEQEDSSERRAQDLMDLAVELKPSLRLPEFVGRFTSNARKMLGAQAAILALTRGARLEIVYAHHVDGKPHLEARAPLDDALTNFAAEHPSLLLTGNARELLGEEVADALEWRDVCMVRLTGREGDLLGILCLVNREREFSAADDNLIQALASHASVALENSRLFSRIEQSKRQWVEDFDAITDLIVVHDPANRIVRLNRSLAEALGARPSELVGMSTRALNSIVTSARSRACPFCSESSSASDESVVSAGTRAYLISTSRIGAGSEEGSRTIHILKDITEQRTYQAQLQRERDFNTKILNHTQSMILVLDTAGLVSYANRKTYESGYSQGDLLGKTLAEFIPRDRRTKFEKAFESTLEGFTPENLELPVRRGNRSTGQFSISLSPIRDEQGHVSSIVVVMTDITDAAVLQAQLRHAEKMAALGQLVSGVAHEINNPLAAIVGYADLLLENNAVPVEAKEELRIVLQEAERTKEIVQNLLQFARQMPARREPLDVHAILRQVVQLRTYGSAGDGMEVAEKYGADVPRVFGDAHQLQQVFLNILNNAYDAVQEARRAGKIEIVTSEKEEFVEVAIRDNGTGISDMARIFEPFYTTKELGKGTGLGLSICYGIVREHNGEVSCTNNSEGDGCTFFVRLPTAQSAAMTTAGEAAK
ncbi:MAG TPA: ATP-binding protein [Candidatus Acidoferrales bacterium]|nr:ATP-binding protein [Candidatus Acidoferrales bacterium]